MPCSPWQVAQIFAFSATGSGAEAAPLPPAKACPLMSATPANKIARDARLKNIPLRSKGQTMKRTGHECPVLSRCTCGKRSIDREGDDVVAALEVDLHVTARADDDVLLPVDGVGGRRRVHAGAREERP